MVVIMEVGEVEVMALAIVELELSFATVDGCGMGEEIEIGGMVCSGGGLG
jgi:hypothetical protein